MSEVYSFRTMPYVFPGMKVADAARRGLRGWNREVAGMGSIAALILATAVTQASGGSFRLEHRLYVPSSYGTLSYDDGSAGWLSWNGQWRGVWFNTTDFGIPGPWPAENSEYWFYHHSSYPWDTSSFYSEIYNGDSSGPAAQLDQTSVTATHYGAVYACYASPIVCEEQFWILENSEMSGGGWPSILSDSSPPPVCHSFYGGPGGWMPWTLGDFFIRSNGGGSLACATWAEIKTLFDSRGEMVP